MSCHKMAVNDSKERAEKLFFSVILGVFSVKLCATLNYTEVLGADTGLHREINITR